MPWLLPLVVFGLVWGEFPPKLPEDFFDKVKAVIDRCEEVTESLQTVKPTGIDVLAIIYDPEEKAFQRWLFETRPDIS
uniref:Divalent-cation tolerance protein CutA n=1 Tax=Bursaphelenchus xylophilus TaxID=6326 RepID=A0A1I7SJC6_BURXY